MGLGDKWREANERHDTRVQAMREAQTQKRVEKLNQKAQDTLPKHGLDFENYDDEELREINRRAVLDVDNALAGTNVYQLGSLMSGGGFVKGSNTSELDHRKAKRADHPGTQKTQWGRFRSLG